MYLSSDMSLCCGVDILEFIYRTEDKQVKLTIISSEKSLVDILTLIKEFDEVMPTLEVIKLAKACIAVTVFYINLICDMQMQCLVTVYELILLCIMLLI